MHNSFDSKWLNLTQIFQLSDLILTWNFWLATKVVGQIIVVSEKHDGQMREITMLPFFRCNKVSFSRRTWSFRVNTNMNQPEVFSQVILPPVLDREPRRAPPTMIAASLTLGVVQNKIEFRIRWRSVLWVVSGNYLLDFLLGGLEMFRLWSLVCLMKWKFVGQHENVFLSRVHKRLSWLSIHQLLKNMDTIEPRKNPLTFHCTGCLIGILIMVYYNPHITG